MDPRRQICSKRIRGAAVLLVVAIGCGGPPRKPEEGGKLVLLGKEGRHEVLAGKMEVVTHRLTNDKGEVAFAVEVRNMSGGTLPVQVDVRFFDADFKTEYAKVPVVFSESFAAGETRMLKGTVDFRTLPEGGRVSRLGIQARIERRGP